MSEFSPKRSRSVLVNTVFCGMPLGASAGGFISAWLIPAYGWREVLIVGGLIPLLLSVFILLLLPESVRFLVAEKKPTEKIRRIIHRIFNVNFASVTTFTSSEPPQAKSAVGVVLSKPYRLGSGMLWTAYFFGLLIIYLLVNWMPLILKDAGFSIERAALISALFTLGGGIGALISGWMMGKFNSNKVVAAAFVLAGILIFVVGQNTGSALILGILIFIMGIAMNGAQSSMPSLAAEFYPTHGRATGVAWMMGIGRLGGISGALIGAELMRRQLGFDQIFTLLAFPAFLAAGALMVKYFAVKSPG
jgi:AAHS family 4-hydroxybenzoate transporter-like MFS transporter